MEKRIREDVSVLPAASKARSPARFIAGFTLAFTAALVVATATQAQVAHSLDQSQPAPTPLQIQNAIPMERTIDPGLTPPGQPAPFPMPSPGLPEAVEGNPGTGAEEPQESQSSPSSGAQ